MQTPATVKLVLRKEKQKKDGTAPVYLRITANRKSRYVSAGVAVEPKHWNENKQQVRASHPIAPALNARLQSVLHEAGRQALEAPSAKAVKAKLVGTTGSLTAYFEGFIEDLDKAGRFWDWKKYRVTLGKLRACLGDELEFADLDRRALVSFEHYLRTERKNNPNTVRKELQRLRAVLKRAVRDGALKPAGDPFLTYDRPKGQKANRRKLTFAEVQALEALSLNTEPTLEAVRDAFVLAFYGGGVRFGDVCRLRPGHVREGRLTYRMMKTGTLVEVPLPPPALVIVERRLPHAEGEGYLFPFLKEGDEADPVHLRRRVNARNVVANKQLKRLAALADLEPDGLSFHVARHSFADYARQRSGDVYAVMKALGHTSLTVTQQYLRSFDRDAVDRLANDLWTDD